MTKAESIAFFEILARYASAKETAAICGVSAATVSKWRKGTHIPRIHHQERLAVLHYRKWRELNK